MKIINNFILLKSLYILLIILSLFLFFFSTTKVEAKSFSIENIEISKPFEIKFDKNLVIDQGFKEAFFELISLILKDTDKKIIQNIKLNEIKGMIETFTIKEERFINETYYVNLGVSFNKKKVFGFLEKKNIFPSIPKKKTFLFIPIIIEEKNRDLLLYSNNKIFSLWNKYEEKFHLIDYVLPTEDIEDLNFLKKKYENIEKYDFKEITEKYFLKDSIIALFFKGDNEIRVLSRITTKDVVNLKNQSFKINDIDNEDQVEKIIKQLKILYEDYWKNLNQINTSIKLSLSVKIKSSDNKKISNFEKNLNSKDFVNSYSISKFDKNFVFYKIIFNGTPAEFLKSMSEDNFYFNTENKIWVLK